MSVEYQSYWLPKGSVLQDRYRVDNVIEEGGMGIVYLGFDTVLQISVSIKEFFPRRHAMREKHKKEIHAYKGKSETHFLTGRDKFIKEARMLAQFQEIDSIVLVKDFFHENNTAYIIMEHVPGKNAKKYVEENGRMNPEWVLSMMEPILRSLQEIHEAGFLHRDISPDNIIIKEDGKAVLVDFGAARISDSEETRTMTVFFKRGYSAEEQYAERSRKGAYTDIYALCATMYYMLTGIRPNESVQRLIRDETKPLPRFRDILMEESAKEAIMKGMSVEVRDRYSSIKKLYQAIYEGGNRKRKRFSKWLLVPGTVILSGTAIIGFLFAGEGSRGNNQFNAREKTAVTENIKADLKSGVTGAAVTASSPQATNMMAVSSPQATDMMAVSPTQAPGVPLTCRIPSVKGLTKKKAVKRIKKNGDSQLKIEFRKEYSKNIKKGKVISQSVKAGTVYNRGAISRIILSVSRGEKKKAPVNTAVPRATSVPVKTRPQNSKRKKTGDGIVGNLPW